ncbi:hypothetical protein [Winogradskyella eximia]|uniref:hypothetical protein n=1 Tax=Winogradskyella eximia TaxID=262006 RepID=UPI0024901E15|nr:hypothetical protein [Winogradskyella eximia]
MGKKKEINEKTFELNITNELLNLSKSFLWYLDDSPICYLFPRDFWKEFLSQNILFAKGLTQDEESSTDGGYDVSINFKKPNTVGSSRLLFLQYKSGLRKKYCTDINSNFNISQKHKRSTEHVFFTFNDAADKSQHGILRNLANKINIQSESVLYVFPRITEYVDFENKLGNLLLHTSFVPVLELDRQASAQKPPISINNGTVHKYRTSYDGNTSEVNFFFFFFFYSNVPVFELLAELICVQIERFAIAFRTYNRRLNIDFTGWVLEAAEDAILNYFGEITDLYKVDENIDFNETFNLEQGRTIVKNIISEYLTLFDNGYSLNSIPSAPQKFSTIIPEDGLVFSFENEDTSNIQYQVF